MSFLVTPSYNKELILDQDIDLSDMCITETSAASSDEETDLQGMNGGIHKVSEYYSISGFLLKNVVFVKSRKMQHHQCSSGCQ